MKEGYNGDAKNSLFQSEVAVALGFQRVELKLITVSVKIDSKN